MPRRRGVAGVFVALVVVTAAQGLVSGAASADPGFIQLVAGQYRGADANRVAVCLGDSAATPSDFNNVPVANAVLDYNLVGLAATPTTGELFIADLGHGRIHKVSGGTITT